jgi:hypothetical protein
MQTNFEPGSYAQNMVDTSIQMLLPVFEQSIVLAGDYCKACKRDFITSMDLKYAMRYCAQHVVGRVQGSLYPEVYDADSDSDHDSDDSLEIVQEDEDSFTRYEGHDLFFVKMNDAFDGWTAWEPQSPIEIMLKNAIEQRD